MSDKTCLHGWRGAPMPERIIDPCPRCGLRSLFIGSGGYLTCSSLECKQPAVGHEIELLKAAATRPLDIEAGVRALRKAVRDAPFAIPSGLHEVVEAAFRTWAREQQGGA